jgi:Zn finger protein HypA/HybF involved in hydrogenase expression
MPEYITCESCGSLNTEDELNETSNICPVCGKPTWNVEHIVSEDVEVEDIELDEDWDDDDDFDWED